MENCKKGERGKTLLAIGSAAAEAVGKKVKKQK